MGKTRKLLSLAVLLLTAICVAAAAAETNPEDSEQGLNEIQTLMEISELDETEGMSLEEMTEAVTETAMSEYIDSSTGFSMQYPSAFVFDDETAEPYAVTADRKATLFIDSMENQGGLDENMLMEAIRFEIPDAEIRKNEQNGCLRVDRNQDNGQTMQTDLYLLTKSSFHHITLQYPAEEKETYFSYIEYMINTMETGETDLG